jgi:hypothetical protein
MTVNDYTPRYSEMRSTYALAATEFSGATYAEAVAEFNRGLTQYESVLTRENRELRARIAPLEAALAEALAHLNEDTSLVEDALAEEDHVNAEETFYADERL